MELVFQGDAAMRACEDLLSTVFLQEQCELVSVSDTSLSPSLSLILSLQFGVTLIWRIEGANKVGHRWHTILLYGVLCVVSTSLTVTDVRDAQSVKVYGASHVDTRTNFFFYFFPKQKTISLIGEIASSTLNTVQLMFETSTVLHSTTSCDHNL